jgi:hypothetical protein
MIESTDYASVLSDLCEWANRKKGCCIGGRQLSAKINELRQKHTVMAFGEFDENPMDRAKLPFQIQ